MYCLRSLIAKGSISSEGQSHSSKLRVLCLSSLRCSLNLLETLTKRAEVLDPDAKANMKQSWRIDEDIKRGTIEENKGTPESMGEVS